MSSLYEYFTNEISENVRLLHGFKSDRRAIVDELAMELAGVPNEYQGKVPYDKRYRESVLLIAFRYLIGIAADEYENRLGSSIKRGISEVEKVIG